MLNRAGPDCNPRTQTRATPESVERPVPTKNGMHPAREPGRVVADKTYGSPSCRHAANAKQPDAPRNQKPDAGKQPDQIL